MLSDEPVQRNRKCDQLNAQSVLNDIVQNFYSNSNLLTRQQCKPDAFLQQACGKFLRKDYISREEVMSAYKKRMLCHFIRKYFEYLRLKRDYNYLCLDMLHFIHFDNQTSKCFFTHDSQRHCSNGERDCVSIISLSLQSHRCKLYAVERSLILSHRKMFE